MAKLFLPDNTVLVNFALIHRMDLLAELIKTHGCWCISVARECHKSAVVDPKYADMTQADAIFGTPLVPDQAEHVDTRTLREMMASPGEPATKHLGEAETVAIMSRRRIDGFFLTDDRDAQAVAVHHRISVVTTWDLLRLAYRTDKLSEPVRSRPPSLQVGPTGCARECSRQGGGRGSTRRRIADLRIAETV